MKQVNLKKRLLPNLPYVFIGLYATKLGQIFRLSPGADLSSKLLHIGDGFAAAFASAAPSFHPADLCVGILLAALMRLAVYIKGKNAKKYRKNMEYTQLFNLLCEKADDEFGGRLPIHVRCLIDEAANIGQIPNLEKLVATIRSREISACLVLQAQSQLKAIYKDNADTIIGNMDSRIFLGGSEPTTLKELSAALGKETIDTFNTGESRGRETSHSLNYQKLGKELASVDELAVLDGGKCILQLRGVRPFLSDKYDITKHPNYKYLSDADARNAFIIEKFLSTRLRLKQEEVYDCYEIDVTQEDAEQASTTA